MGSFPAKSKQHHTQRGSCERTSPPLPPGVKSVVFWDDCSGSVAHSGEQEQDVPRQPVDPPPRASFSVHAPSSAPEGAVHSQTLRPGTPTVDGWPPNACADTDNLVHISTCACSTFSLECDADATMGGKKHSLPFIITTPFSAGITSAGTDSLPASVSPVAINPRRGYVGDEIDLVTPCDMDDFALASIGDATGMAFACNGTGHSSTGTLTAVGSVGAEKGSATDGRDGGEEDVVDFVSFRRPGLKWCARCQSELPHLSNFCPQCGCPTSSVCEDSSGGGATLVREAQNTSALSMVSSQDGSGYVVSFSTTPITPRLDGHASLRPQNSSHVSPVTPTFSRSGASMPLVSFKEDESVQRAHHARAYRRRIRIDRSPRGLLGRGAAGVVYKALDIRNGQQMAVKVMDLKATDADDLVAIRNELRHLSRLRHTNVVEYFGCRVEEYTLKRSSIGGARSSSSFSQVEEDLITLVVPDSPRPPREMEPVSHGMRIFVLMERLECGSLAETLRTFEGGLPTSTVLVYTVQLVDAVLHVHRCGITHRDIKPANILLASDGTVKMADFGCATVHAVSSVGECTLDVEGEKKVAGTPAYMPPETLSILADNAHDKATMAMHHRAQDIWGLGCTVHQLLTGEEPWASLGTFSTPFSLLMQMQDKPFPISPRVTGVARQFLELCFEPDPKTRVANSTLLPQHPFLAER